MKDRNKIPKYASFEDWISQARIYIGWARYGKPGGHGFVVATCYEPSEELEEAIDELDAGDNEASKAAEIIEEMDCWYANDPDPALAMQKLMGKMREYQRVVDGELRERKEA